MTSIVGAREQLDSSGGIGLELEVQKRPVFSYASADFSFLSSHAETPSLYERDKIFCIECLHFPSFSQI